MKEEKINRSDQHTFTWLFLGGLIASDCFLIRIMAYSEVVKYWHQPSTLPRLTYESPEHKEDTGQHPGLYCRQTLGLRGVGGDRVEDVDQHQEQGHQERHPARDDVRRHHEADPGHHHEQSRRKIVCDEVVREMTFQDHLEPGHAEVAQLSVAEDPVLGLQRNDRDVIVQHNRIFRLNEPKQLLNSNDCPFIERNMKM